MDTGQIVVVSCGAPREKFWGVLLSLTAVGATVRAVPLDAFEDFASQFREGQQVLIAPMTVSYLIIALGLLNLFNLTGVRISLLTTGIGHVVINLPLCFAITYLQTPDRRSVLPGRRALPC